MRLCHIAVVALLPCVAAGPARTGGRGDTSFRNGQDASVAYTAGGTSSPCTGLNCQDNPLGNPCPCPVWKPCKHDNLPDGHCMYRVNIAGQSVSDDDCANVIPGTWSAVIAGQENRGDIAGGNCMCTAGSSDIYESKEWGICNRTEPKWCDKDWNGNACGPRNCEFQWTSWSACTKSCGGGTQERTALVTLEPLNNGTACPSVEKRKCNIKECIAPTPAPPAKKCDTKAMNAEQNRQNNKEQVNNMRQGLQATKDGCRDLAGELCNRREETTNLREEKLNAHLLSCDGVENCVEHESESIVFSYSE